MTPLSTIRQALGKAHEVVSDLCSGKRKWTMCIPAQPNYDPDLLIGDALRHADELCDRVEALEGALRKYGQHEEDCPSTIPQRDQFRCDCGLRAALGET